VIETAPPPPEKGVAPSPPAGFEEIRFGDIYIRLPPTLEAVKTAKTLLDLQEKRVQAKVETEKKTLEEEG
jgi:hypothetical protein